MPLDLPVPIAILVVVFALTGGVKVLGAPQARKSFRRWGFPPFFRVTIGIVELGGAALLTIEHTRSCTAAVLILVMVGALGTHIKHGERTMAVVPIALGALLGHICIAYCT